jgi:hypothetical protein
MAIYTVTFDVKETEKAQNRAMLAALTDSDLIFADSILGDLKGDAPEYVREQFQRERERRGI